MGATLLGVPRLFADDGYRARVVRHVGNAKVRSFWLDEFETWDKRFRSEAVSPIQNKAGALLTSPVLRNVLAGFHGTAPSHDASPALGCAL